MSESLLTTELDAHQAARQHRKIDMQIPLGAFERLAPLLSGPAGTANVSLQFDRDMYGIDHLHGRIRAQLPLTCERCAEPFLFECETVFRFGLVLAEGAAGQVEENEEPFVTEGKPISLQALVEDELLLSLPMVPKHRDEDCSVKEGRFEI